MAFYFQPPTGNASYEKLEDYALKRLRLLLRLSACKNEEERKETVLDANMVNWSECLIAGSIKDKISHYAVRLSMACNTNSSRFFCKAETVLFRMRLDNFSIQEWVSFFKTVTKNLLCYQNEELTNLQVMFETLMDETESWALLAEGIKNNDEIKCIHLPFQLLFQLVSKRLVVLKQGSATVPFSLIPDVLEEQFHGIMSSLLHQALQERRKTTEDARLLRLSAVLMRAYKGEVHPVFNIPLRSKPLTLDTIMSSKDFFPPCMSRLITQLEKHHRLCHHDRIQLTLFLKELGLSIHEALLFWRREYSKPVNCDSKQGCKHDWHGNERRYIYNIRHLYGLEGKRVCYAAHSCTSIQDRQLTLTDHGGCPFTSLDSSSLNSYLSKQNFAQPDIEDIVICSKSGHVEQACGFFMCHKLKSASKIGCVVYQTPEAKDGKINNNTVCHSRLKLEKSPSRICGCNSLQMSSIKRIKTGVEEIESHQTIDTSVSEPKKDESDLNDLCRRLNWDHSPPPKLPFSTVHSKAKTEQHTCRKNTYGLQPANITPCCCKNEVKKVFGEFVSNNDFKSIRHKEHQNQQHRKRKLFHCQCDKLEADNILCVDDKGVELDHDFCSTQIDGEVNSSHCTCDHNSLDNVQEFDTQVNMKQFVKFLYSKPIHLKKPSTFYWDFRNLQSKHS